MKKLTQLLNRSWFTSSHYIILNDNSKTDVLVIL